MTGDSLLRLGSRSSPLARAQAEWIASQLAVCPALVWVKSQGDQDRTTEIQTPLMTCIPLEATLKARRHYTPHKFPEILCRAL